MNIIENESFDLERALYESENVILKNCYFQGEADGESALMLVCARLRHVVSTQWGSKKYMDMKHLYGCGAKSVLD